MDKGYVLALKFAIAEELLLGSSVFIVTTRPASKNRLFDSNQIFPWIEKSIR